MPRLIQGIILRIFEGIVFILVYNLAVHIMVDIAKGAIFGVCEFSHILITFVYLLWFARSQTDIMIKISG